jgi:hypothetical protein
MRGHCPDGESSNVVVQRLANALLLFVVHDHPDRGRETSSGWVS